MTINRHNDTCYQSMRINKSNCECGAASNDPHWCNRQLEVIDKCMLAFAKCQHYQDFNQRLKKFFVECLPEYSVSLMNDSWHGVHVWGNGIRYDDGVSIRWWHNTITTDSWHVQFKEAAQRLRSQLKARLDQMTKEDALEQQIERMNERVIAMIKEARELVGNASSDLTIAYPILFKGNYDV